MRQKNEKKFNSIVSTCFKNIETINIAQSSACKLHGSIMSSEKRFCFGRILWFDRQYTVISSELNASRHSEEINRHRFKRFKFNNDRIY